jgi:anti-sigma factor RsiW
VSEPEPETCDRFHAAVSLQLDGELSPLESALLRAHAVECARCRAYASDVRRIAAHLRASPLRVPSHHIPAPARPTTHGLQRAFYAAAAIAVLVSTAGLGAGGGHGGTQGPQSLERGYLQSIDYERRLLAALSRPRPALEPAHTPAPS